MEILKWIGLGFGALTATGGVLTGAWHLGEATGYRPALKYELEEQGWFNRRIYLLDKVKAGKINQREIGELCGLSAALRKAPPAVCETEQFLSGRVNQ